MAIDISCILKEKINLAHDKQQQQKQQQQVNSKTGASKSSKKSVLSSLKAVRIKSSSSDSKQLREVIGYANRLRNDIELIRKFLIENRRDYIGVYSLYKSKLTDDERNQIDEEVGDAIKEFQVKIERLEKKAFEDKSLRAGSQKHQIVSAIIQNTRIHHKMVCDMFTNLREFRLKRSLDKRKLTRLDSDYEFTGNLVTIEDPVSSTNVHSNDNFPNEGEDQFESLESFNNDSHNYDADEPDYRLAEQDGFTPKDIQKLKAENNKILLDFEEMVGETRQITKALSQIEQLSKTYQEHFFQQNEEINRVQTIAFETTANIKGGNEQVRSAIRNKGRLTLWFLFCNVVLTFTLFFLDWYNP